MANWKWLAQLADYVRIAADAVKAIKSARKQ